MEIFTYASAKGSGGGGSDLPSPGPSGNVLTSNGSKWGSAAPEKELPSPETSGNVLTSNGSAWTSAAPEKELPAASGNNGKVLGVSNGAYSLVSPSDLSIAPFNVELTMIGGDFVMTTEPSEVYAAYSAHRPVYIDLPAMSARNYLQVCEYTNDQTFHFVFSCTQVYSNSITVIAADFENSATCTINVKTAEAT